MKRATGRPGRAIGRASAGAALGFVALLGGALPARAQDGRATVGTAILPDTLHVGDVARAALRVRLPLNARVQFPDTLSVPTDVEAAGTRQLQTDTVDGQLEVTAIYPITAWRPGPFQLPPASILFAGETGVDSLVARFPEAHVISMLPEDTAGVEPRPAKDVFGGDRVWWPLLAGLALLLALAALLYWLWAGRRDRTPAPLAPIGPTARERALALMERARSAGLVEKNELKAFYSLVAEAVRGYMEAVEPAWGADLTTTELLPRLHARDAVPVMQDVLRVLHRADLVKFARFQPATAEAYGDWSVAYDWIERFDGVDREVAAVADEAVPA